MTTPFQYIPGNLLVPGFFFEVRPLDNTGLLQFQSLLMGQVTSGGSLGPILATTNGTTASGNPTLHFASTPAAVVIGMSVRDLTTGASIPAGTTVTAVSGTTVTMSANAAGAGVGGTDSIQFYAPTAPILVSNVTQAKQLFGVGSMLANMYAEYRVIDGLGTVYCLPLIDDPASVKATGQISITGTVTQTSVIYLYVAGVRVPVNVTSTMTNADIAVACVAAINAASDLPCVASGSTFPITLTARNAGACGNDIDIRINYLGARSGESTPTGLTVSITPMASGAVNPVLTTPLATLGSIPFDIIAAPYADATSLTAMATFFSDINGRWSYLQELFGHYMTAASLTVGGLTTLGANTNNQHISILGLNKSPTPPYQLAAALGAQASVSLRADPGLPYNTLPLTGCQSPAVADRFLISDRQALLAAGIATARSDSAGNLIIDRIVTTYTTNSFSQVDTSYQNAEKLQCIAYTVKYTASILSGLYARVKLAADGTRIVPNSNLVTPSTVKGTMISIYGDLVDLGICQNFTNFTKNVKVEINLLNPNRLDITMPITTIFQLDTTAVLVQLVI